MDFDSLLKAVDLVVIVAIIAITEAVKRAVPEKYWRLMPIVPLVLGIAAGFVVTTASEWRAFAKAAMLYAGAASLAYEIGRTTLFGAGAKAETKLPLP
jgi:hypothetical protein